MRRALVVCVNHAFFTVTDKSGESGMNFDVKNKVALVTGANRGIGLAITKALLENGANKVYAAVRNLNSAADLKQEYGERIEVVKIDLEDHDTIAAAAKLNCWKS